MANQATPFFKDGRTFPTQRQLDEAVNELAEQLSRGLGLNEASDRMGVSRGTGLVLYRDLCLRYGERPQ